MRQLLKGICQPDELRLAEARTEKADPEPRVIMLLDDEQLTKYSMKPGRSDSRDVRRCVNEPKHSRLVHGRVVGIEA